MKHILYANNDFNAVQDALNAGTLENPYIAAVTSGSGIFIDYNTLEQQSCAQRGLCGDDPTDCHVCTCEESYPGDPAAICDCEGGYYWGDECHDEPEPEEPCAGMEEEEAACVAHGGEWDIANCMCIEPDPCEGYETQEECDCVQQGGTWEGSECVMSSDDPCGGDPECECNQESDYNWWDGDTCHNCYDEWESLGYSSPEDCACDKRGEDSVCQESDPCAGYGSLEECECAQQGGTWSGSECQMPSD